MVVPLLPKLDLDMSNLIAIPLLFDDAGEFIGYDKSSDLINIKGKAVVATKYYCFFFFMNKAEKYLLTRERDNCQYWGWSR